MEEQNFLFFKISVNTMKTKLMIAVLVAFLFGLSSFAIHFNRDTTPNNSEAVDTPSVRICPHSGLPCNGDGQCKDHDQSKSHDENCCSH
jgi:hypothetical protein